MPSKSELEVEESGLDEKGAHRVGGVSQCRRNREAADQSKILVGGDDLILKR